MRRRLIDNSDVLDYIVQHIREHGYPPPRRRLAVRFATSNRRMQIVVQELASAGELELVVYPRSTEAAATLQIPTNKPYLFKERT